MFRVLAFITALMSAAIGSTAGAAEFVGTGERARLPLLMLGCERRTDMERIIELHRQGDKEAANALIGQRVPSCRPLDAGTVGVVEDRTIMPPQLACLRPLGEPTCLWLPANTVGKP